MAAPTETEIQAQGTNLARVTNEFRKFLAVNATNYLGTEDTYVQSLETEFFGAAMAALSDLRGLFSTANSIGQYQSLFTPILQEYGRFIDATLTDVDTIFLRLYDRFVSLGLTVQSRDFTFGGPLFAGATGDGLINRLNTDADGFDIENQTPDSKEAECQRDQFSGAEQHEEVFTFRGESPEPESLRITGSGRQEELTALSAQASASFIDNASFSIFEGTLTIPTDISGWTPTTDIGNFEMDQTTTFRGFPGETTRTAVKFKTNDKLTQKFTVREPDFDALVPIYTQIVFDRSTFGADGTLTLRVGSQSVSVVLAAQVGYTILRIPIGTANWFDNFNQSDPGVEIELTGNTVGEVLVDDGIIAPYTRFDGSWYAVVGGATAFLRKDTATWTDTAVESILQFIWWYAFGRYLPHTTGVASWPDP